MATYQCANCAKTFTRTRKPEGLPHCSHSCYITRKRTQDTLVSRFWSRVDKTGSCWLWTGTKIANGYGVLYSGVARGKTDHTVYAHRVSYEIHHGTIPPGMVVRHGCDVPLCVRPDHLSLGSYADNMRDMVTRGRSAKGDNHSQAKLTAESVVTIRARLAAREPQAAIARDFGVDASSISNIATGKHWQHV